MNMVFRLMAFMLIFNISIGIMLTAIPAFEDNAISTGGIGTYNANYSTGFTTSTKEVINPNGVVEDAGDANYRVLDMINLGFIKRFLNAVDKYLFGFIRLLYSLIGGYMDEGLRNFLFGPPGYPALGVLQIMMTVAYIFGAIKLWTGKDLTER